VVTLDEVFTRSSPGHHPETLAETHDETSKLLEAIRGIDPVRQELLVLKFSEGLSNAAIGRILGRSEGAIKSLYHRTLLQIRRDLQQKGLKIE
jgi:RNA polymerase sigma-70 factor (ECF subfamily)